MPEGSIPAVGIDVAKAQLDLGLDDGSVHSFANDPDGCEAVRDRLVELSPKVIVIEATGGYERSIVAELAAAGLPVVVVNPRQVRDLHAPPADWPRPTRSMRWCWRGSAPPSSRRGLLCRTNRPSRCVSCSPDAGRWST